MDSHEFYMRRCIELAASGFNAVRPNPLVGAVIVVDGKILAEGYHQRYGGPHAEVEALTSVSDRASLGQATMYVSLEPCNHQGKTPPCVDAIIAAGIPRVVIGARDTNPKAGGGVERLRAAGVEVITGVLEEECRKQNCRFFTYHEKKRPYVILKWAQTQDGFIAREDYSSKWISSEKSRERVHVWRSQEASVLVGTTTAIQDNPRLTARLPGAMQPHRVIIDRRQKIPTSFHVFDESAPTILYNEIENYTYPAATLVKLDFAHSIAQQILRDLHARQIQSVIVEGGAHTLEEFINSGMWDEARVFTSPTRFECGIKAPMVDGIRVEAITIEGSQDALVLMLNPQPAKI